MRTFGKGKARSRTAMRNFIRTPASLCFLVFLLVSGPWPAGSGPGQPPNRPGVFLVRYVERADGSTETLFKGYVPRRRDHRSPGEVEEQRLPEVITEGEDSPHGTIVELSGLDSEKVLAAMAARGVSAEPVIPQAPSRAPFQDVATLIDEGPAENRIDLVFLGDGYTMEEQGKFFRDIRRLVKEMFEDVTYASFRPLFNVHAVFRPSRESGIGRNSTPKDTAFKLYRVGLTLRAIYCGDPAAAQAAASAAPDCDYLIIIANDPYYGGIGGNIIIATCSENNGTVVLRHELGHGIGVGDEYDGTGYFGANFAPTLASLPWSSWLTEPQSLRAEPGLALYVDWPWHLLSGNPFVARFSSPGGYASRLIRLSVSGQGSPGDNLAIALDGVPLAYSPPADQDRYFYDYALPGGFAAGSHVLSVQETRADGDNYFCNMTIHEYGPDYHFDPGYIGAYPLFSPAGILAGYRPTDESCCMRNMNQPLFCPVCLEELWLKIMARISIIDEVLVYGPGPLVLVNLKTAGLGQFRTDGKRKDGEILEIRWFRDGLEQTDLAGKTAWTKPKTEALGSWESRVTFRTPEVRNDPRNLLVHRKFFSVSS